MLQPGMSDKHYWINKVFLNAEVEVRWPESFVSMEIGERRPNRSRGVPGQCVRTPVLFHSMAHLQSRVITVSF